MLHGYDISGYQSASWTTRTDMLFVKATENTGYTSPHFASQFTAAKKLAKVHGVYHFARPGRSSANAQADHFLAVVGPHLDASTLLVLDLEVSQVSQAATNKFAVDFAARLKARHPSHRRVLYMGGGYSATNTGRDLAKHYHLWWYPRYPSTANRTAWPASFTPDAPAGHTGWSRPDIWQFTSNFGSSHLDANISDRSVAYLLGNQEDDMPLNDADKKWLAGPFVDAVRHAVLEKDAVPTPVGAPDIATNKTYAFQNVGRETYTLTQKVLGVVSALAAKTPDVDEEAIVRGILATLTPQAIADALPPELAKEVVDELTSRLES